MVFGLFSRIRRAHSPQPSPLSSPKPNLDPSSLHALFLSVPPKTLQSYTISHLNPPPSPHTLAALSSFFEDLTPPPRLHCLRCHKDFYEVENTDRSCLVPHDDESAEVERVGRSAGANKGKATEYETLWGCCGQSVEGDGDMGPPDGWCYEGKHTTDAKRARFRADSTLHEDKLISCDRLDCHVARDGAASSRSSRKRARVSFTDCSSDGSGSDAEDSVKTKPVSKVQARIKNKGKKTSTMTAAPDADGDISMNSENSFPNPNCTTLIKLQSLATPTTAKPKQTHVRSRPMPTAPSPSPKPSTTAIPSTPASTSPKSKAKQKPRSDSKPRSTARARSKSRTKVSSVDGGADARRDSGGDSQGQERRKVSKRRKIV